MLLVEALANQKLTYLHISLGDFRSTTQRYSEGEINQISVIQQVLNGRMPLIGVGSIYKLEDAQHAAQFGSDLVALGRGLLIEPQWVEKVECGEVVSTEFNQESS